MTPRDLHGRTLTPDRLRDALDDVAGTARLDYLDDLVRQAARTRQRPGWTFPERWPLMTLITHPGTRVREDARRPIWIALILALTLALVAGLVAGAVRLLQPDLFRSVLTMPSVSIVSPFAVEISTAGTQFGGLDVGPDGRIVIADVGNERVLVLSPSGELLATIGSSGSEPGRFSFHRVPSDTGSYLGGAAWMADGSIVVADTVNRRIQVLSDTGEVLRTWGGYGPADGQFIEPFDVAVSAQGVVHVVDDQRDDISRFDATGTFRDRIGRHGSGDGEMDFTSAVAVDAADNVFNADYGNQRVQSWDASGGFRWSTAIPVGADPAESQPVDVDVDADGYVYVTTVDRRLLILSPDGRILSAWQDPRDTGDGPIGVGVAPDGTVYLASLVGGDLRKLTMARTTLLTDTSPVPTEPDATTDPAASAEPSTAPDTSPAAMITLGSSGVFDVPVSFSATERWHVNAEARGALDLQLVRDPDNWPAYVTAFVPIDVYRDPCQASLGLVEPPIGPGVDDLVDALIAQPGFTVGEVTDVVIDGHHGKQFDLENTIDIRGCTGDPWLPQWTFDQASEGVSVPADASSLPRSHQRIAILDVDGKRVLLQAWTMSSTRPDEIEEAWAVFDSVDFP